MATSQMIRKEETTGNWASMFPVEQITEQQCALFAKKLLAVAISNITYLRAIFPEKAYGDRWLGDLHLKILKDDSSCLGATQVIKWVKGCFDALEKKYLRMLVIGIYVDPKNPQTVIESYTFKFSYSTQCGVEIFRDGKKITSAYSSEETRKATVKMLRTIVVLTQTMEPLPDNVMMTMKILYYDEVTPPDYEPPGFSPSNFDAFNYEDDIVNVKLGDVSTPFHCVKMRIKTNKTQFNLDDEIEDKTVENATISNSGLDQEGESQKLKDEEKGQSQQQKSLNSTAVTTNEADISINSQAMPETRKENVPATPKSAKEEFKVCCPCGCNEDDGLMIVCDVCELWQHAVCFGILDEEHAPEEHVCDTCAKEHNTRKPTDPFLKEKNTFAVQATCLWRRTLAAMAEYSRILPQQLAHRLGIDNNVAQGLLKRLEKEGFVLTPNKGKRLGKVVDKEKVQKEGIQAYFKMPEKRAENTEEEDPMEISRTEKELRTQKKHFDTDQSKDSSTNPSDVSHVIDKAANISLDSHLLRSSAKLKPGLSVLKSRDDNTQNEANKLKNTEKKRGQKRAFSKDGQGEFDICDSQESHDTRSSRRRKCSDVNKSIKL